MIVTVGLAACGEGSETEEKEVSGVESTDNSDDSANGEEAAEETDEEDGSKEEFDQEIVDNDNFKATLTSVEKIVDRKSTRLNSSHVAISYAVFCLKKKK